MALKAFARITTQENHGDPEPGPCCGSATGEPQAERLSTSQRARSWLFCRCALPANLARWASTSAPSAPGWLDDAAFEAVPLFVSRNRLLGERRPRSAATHPLGLGLVGVHRDRAARAVDRPAAGCTPAGPPAGGARSAAWTSRPFATGCASRRCWQRPASPWSSIRCDHPLAARTPYPSSPSVPWMPILQGWGPEDYLRHAGQDQPHGIDLAAEPVVGVGSEAAAVCIDLISAWSWEKAAASPLRRRRLLRERRRRSRPMP